MAKRKSLEVGSKRKRALRNVPLQTFVNDYIYRIDLDADYQRDKIWSRSNQEELLDSILQDIDIPKIYLMRVEGNESFDFECIDGKQRMTAILSFMKPDPSEERPIAVQLAGERYPYKRLCEELPKLADKIHRYELTLVEYPELDDTFLREIFRRLQLGVRLNAGELLKTYMGTIRDFVYKDMGKDAPFLRNTTLSDKRFSRPFTLAQICINSFSRAATGDFVRARYDDLSDFFKDKYDLRQDDKNLQRIRKVLTLMDREFKNRAAAISSRAVAVSAYLFVEDLFLSGRQAQVGEFAEFFEALLEHVKHNLELVAKFEKPMNSVVLEEFQKYVAQASVEPYAIRRRHEFLEKAFACYRAPKTKGRILGQSH